MRFCGFEERETISCRTSRPRCGMTPIPCIGQLETMLDGDLLCRKRRKENEVTLQ